MKELIGNVSEEMSSKYNQISEAISLVSILVESSAAEIHKISSNVTEIQETIKAFKPHYVKAQP
jgi:methyl-accepting chemotaxis protein